MESGQVESSFPELIPSIRRIIFEDGGFFGGYRRTAVHFSGDKALFDVEKTIGTAPDEALGRCAEMAKSEFLAEVRQLHIEQWAKNYRSPDLDGEQWTLEIRFSGGRRPLKIEGSNAFPPNFENLQRPMAPKKDRAGKA